MTLCSKCGATLPDGAHYCMQCGTPSEPPEPQEPLPLSLFLQPAVTGGAILGILSSIPIVSLGNWLCCMWVVAGGALSAWLLGKALPEGAAKLTYGDGAFAGVLSGAFGAIVATAFSIPMRLLSAEALRSQMETVEDMLADLEGPFRELILQLLSPELSLVTILATFFVNVVVFSLFAMVGGILLVAMTAKKAGLKRST